MKPLASGTGRPSAPEQLHDTLTFTPPPQMTVQHRRRSLLACALVLSLLPVGAGAQARYASTRDTLRFREVTRGEVRLVAPQGEIPMASEHMATIAVVRTAGDTARAWFEDLTIGVTSPMGAQRPSTADALHAPFTLTFDDRGRVKLLAAPSFPASFEGVTDLTRQFDDFFFRLPTAPLRVGYAWSDTSGRTDSTATSFTRTQSVASYRVERDTTVDGVPAVVVSMRQQLSSRSDRPIPNQPGRAVSTLTGADSGIVIFAPQAGRFLGRQREGLLQGDLIMRGAGGEMALKQSYRYTSTVTAVR